MTIGFYAGWNQVVPDPKKGSKWHKNLCANQVLYGCQAGSKKDFKGFYTGPEIVPRIWSQTGVKHVVSGLKKGSVWSRFSIKII